MTRQVFVVGAGAHAWGKWPDETGLTLGISAVTAALTDAGLEWGDAEGLVAASSRFGGGLGWGLHANELLQAVGERPIPCVNVGGACAAGAIAFQTAWSMVASGAQDIVVAVGAERMPKGFITRPPGGADDLSDQDYLRWAAMGATNPAYWSLEARRRMHDHATTEDSFARAALLMRENAAGNMRARFRKPITIDEIAASPMVADPLRLLEICAVSDGGAAVVLASEAVARRASAPIRVAGCAIATGAFGDPARRIPNIASTVRPGVPHTAEVVTAVERARAMAGITPAQIDVLEIADNTAWHLLAWPEMLGFCAPGDADRLLAEGAFSRAGELALNPSGGFLSFGEATTAQALLQICELTWQLRGEAEGHQVVGATIGQTAVLGLGGNGGSVVLSA
ncbi:lipid-transfer protein [Sphingomonas sp. 1P06PA]|uniref:lipid-transfer protein n=1 Tax=Sphingomonas sp. 1P06PA TaxID=554121 RepID=UPI0039A6DEE0